MGQYWGDGRGRPCARSNALQQRDRMMTRHPPLTLMSSRRLLIVQGHPDPAGNHFCHALARSYADAPKRQRWLERLAALGRRGS
jgi:hypothetical protein